MLYDGKAESLVMATSTTFQLRSFTNLWLCILYVVIAEFSKQPTVRGGAPSKSPGSVAVMDRQPASSSLLEHATPAQGMSTELMKRMKRK